MESCSEKTSGNCLLSAKFLGLPFPQMQNLGKVYSLSRRE